MKTQEAKQKFITSRTSNGAKANTLRWYNERLGHFERFLPELPTEPEPVEEFLNTMNGVPETKRASYRAIRALYRFLEKRYRLPNPMTFIDAPRCPKKLMPTLEATQMAELRDLGDNLRDRTILTLVSDNGARAGEVASLRKDGIGSRTIRVTGKTGEREIPISEETRELLLQLMATNGGCDHVFVGQKGPLTPSGIYHLVQNYMIKADIHGPKQGPHRMRHGFAKNFLKNGGDLRTLQEILGHANISTTAMYLNLDMDDIVEKHQKFTPLHMPDMTAAAALREVEWILKAKRGEPVGAAAKRVEQPVNQSNCEAKKLASVMKTSDGASKWVTPPLPGLSGV